MNIELLDENNEVIVVLKNVRDIEKNFENHWQKLFNAASWKEHVLPDNPRALAKAKQEAISEIEYHIGLIRQQYLTHLPGQVETYAAKADDAQRYKNAKSPSLSKFPWLQAEVNATGKDPLVAANDILSKRDAWLKAGPAIEQERIRAKKEINSITTTVEDIIKAKTVSLQNLSNI